MQSLHHENIVSYYGSFKHNSCLVIAMYAPRCTLFSDAACIRCHKMIRELCAKGSLDDLIAAARREGRTLPEDVMLKIAGQIA